MEAVSLERVREEFSSWRKNRVGRERIPDFLWSLCVRCAAENKLSILAKAAGVDYYQLKARIEKATTPKSIAVSALSSPVSPPRLVAKICFSHESGWKIEVDPTDPASLHFMKSFVNAGEHDAASLASDSNLSRPQSGRLSKGNRVTRRIYLGATTD